MAAFNSLAQALKEVHKETATVDLTGVDIRDAGVSDLAFALRKCSNVRELILSDCKLGPKAAVHLATFLKYNKTVTRLYLQHNPGLGDKGIEEISLVLKANKSLEVLNLSGCAMTDTGAAALAGQLPNAANLKKLYLYNNEIGYTGALALAKLIRERPAALQELFMWDNPVGEDGLDALKEAYESARIVMKDTGLPFLQLVTGLKNEKVAKKKAPEVKRNFKVPTKPGQDKGPIIDDSSTGDFASLRAKAQTLEAPADEIAKAAKGAPPPQISLVDPPKKVEPAPAVEEKKGPAVVPSSLMRARANLFESPSLAAQHKASSAPETSCSSPRKPIDVGGGGLVTRMRAQASEANKANTPARMPRKNEMEAAHAPQKFSLVPTGPPESSTASAIDEKTAATPSKIAEESEPVEREEAKMVLVDEVQAVGEEEEEEEKVVDDDDDATAAALAADAAKLEAEIAALQEQLVAGNIPHKAS